MKVYIVFKEKYIDIGGQGDCKEPEIIGATLDKRIARQKETESPEYYIEEVELMEDLQEVCEIKWK